MRGGKYNDKERTVSDENKRILSHGSDQGHYRNTQMRKICFTDADYG